VDDVGLKQLVGATFCWTVQLPSDMLGVTILSGPPMISAWKVAAFHFYAYKNGTQAGGAQFEVKLNDDTGWSVVLCDEALCNYSTPALPMAHHEAQIRARDIVTGVAGAPALWRWTVSECLATEYAYINPSGALNCTACPVGGNCSAKGTTVDTIMAMPDWWSQPGNVTARLIFYKCLLPGSKYP
jgi:hypothetical protein